MRNFLSLVLSFVIIITAVPVISLYYKDEIISKSENFTEDQTTEAETKQAEEVSVTPLSSAKSDKVKVYLSEEKKVITVKKSFYIISVLAKEIDISAPAEALKAQAVCIATFLKRTSENLKDEKYDITDNPEIHQSFLTEKKLKDFWKDNYKKNYEKLEKIVLEVDGQYLTYKSQTVLAAYHSSNSGKTESAENYWGESYDYLVSVPSIGDTLCADYKNEVKFTPKELKEKFEKLKDKEFSFPESPSDWFGSVSATPTGTVTEAEIAGVSLSGREIREALGLKSAVFSVSYKNENFIFTVSGYGHGVGLSQQGAIYMAKLGFSYQDILLHYYNGVEITHENSI